MHLRLKRRCYGIEAARGLRGDESVEDERDADGVCDESQQPEYSSDNPCVLKALDGQVCDEVRLPIDALAVEEPQQV